MQGGPLVYDPKEKKFVSRQGAGPQDGQVPVDPMAGSLASIEKMKKGPVPKWKAIFWIVIAVMFIGWIALIFLWGGQVRERREEVLRNPKSQKLQSDLRKISELE